MKRVVIAAAVDAGCVGRLEALPEVEVVRVEPKGKEWELPAEWVRGTEVMVCRQPPANWEAMTELRVMQLGSVGYEHLREVKLWESEVRVCNARGVFDTAIGEWCLGMMINLRRDVRAMMRNQEAAAWERTGRFAEEIRGRTVGLWGYGGIGRETARLAKAFGMTVHAMTRSGVKPRRETFAWPGSGDAAGTLPDRVFTAGQEREFLAGLDFLVLALPHTKRSEGMVGEEELRALPRTACLLNPARGPIVREAALVKALAEGWIAGAALDTHYVYPLPAEHPLWGMRNVILTPHVSGSDLSSDFPARMGELVVENVRRHVAGEGLLNELTRKEWGEA